MIHNGSGTPRQIKPNMTDQPTDRPTDQPKDRHEGRLRFQLNKKKHKYVKEVNFP